MAGTVAGAAKRGQRNPDLLRPPVTQEAGAVYVGRRAIKVGEETWEPGTLVPDAEKLFPRIESWFRTGALVRR